MNLPTGALCNISHPTTPTTASPLILTSPPHTVCAALALSNSLDLRPATAAAPSSDRGLGSTSRFDDDHFPSQRHDEHPLNLIKETDLGGLSSALFTPTASGGQRIASGKARQQNGPGGGSGSDATASVRASAGRWGAQGAGEDGHAGAGQLASWGQPSGAAGGAAAGDRPHAASPRAGAAAATAAAAAQDGAWAMRSSGVRPQQHHQPGVAAAAAYAAAEAARQEDEEAFGVGGRRLVQSARPVTRHGQELDPSVWQQNIGTYVSVGGEGRWQLRPGGGGRGRSGEGPSPCV